MDKVLRLGDLDVKACYSEWVEFTRPGELYDHSFYLERDQAIVLANWLLEVFGSETNLLPDQQHPSEDHSSSR